MTTQRSTRGRRFRAAAHVIATAAWLAATSAACARDSTAPATPVPAAGRALRILAGAGVSDTVMAPLVQALTVEVLDDAGRPAVGVEVRFQTALSADSGRRQERAVYVCTLTATRCEGSSLVRDTVDARGRASVLVQLGTVAGPGTVSISVPALSLADSARFTVGAGSLGGVRSAVRDTAVFIGGSLTLRGVAIDRFGNVRPDPVTFVATDHRLAILPSGVVSGLVFGRSAALARAGAVVDTVRLSVVPRGTIAAHALGGSAPQLVVVDLDGSGYRTLVPVLRTSQGAWPSWSRDGTAVVYQDGAGATSLWIVEGTASPRLLIGGSGSRTWPVHSADGNWLYYVDGLFTGTIMRARPDGSESAVALPGDWYGYPAPSPNGRELAVYSPPTGISIVNLTDGRRTAGWEGWMSRWAPDGSVVAYLANGLASGQPCACVLTIVTVDGREPRVIGRAIGPFDWSPDGRYVVASPVGGISATGLSIIDVATGEAAVLPFATRLNQPAWRPVATVGGR